MNGRCEIYRNSLLFCSNKPFVEHSCEGGKKEGNEGKNKRCMKKSLVPHHRNSRELEERNDSFFHMDLFFI